MAGKDLIKRWDSDEMKILRSKVLKYIRSNKPFDGLGLGKIAGRWDLRGIRFPKPKKKEKLKVNGGDLDLKKRTYNLANVSLHSIDFSYADISECVFVKCTIENCIFESSILKNIECVACNFSNGSFIKTNLSNSSLALNRGVDSGSFKNIEFIESNLSKVSFRFPVIDNCKFINCKLYEVNFDGSRFSNSKFIGKFESGWINGYSRYASKSLFGIFNRVNPYDYPNLMKNVDFLEAELEDVLFNYKVDLRDCKFQERGDFIIVKNLPTTYIKAREIIEKDWSREDKRQGLFLIDNFYNSEMKNGMPMDYIDTSYNKHLGRDFQKIFFDLIESIDSELLNQ
ncbi:hypothetical protein GCM10011506_18910 [Marivirga lumbricoides]|uniref:Pentapeptide repeat-containing protein n=1 Tax=Marivirga lumbricoides TaxID=1046115 RepID=A0ABQ1M5E6_9BACT|nr:hypothetical protein GCM10011506_18910 [Marivirga lumbricoides]